MPGWRSAVPGWRRRSGGRGAQPGGRRAAAPRARCPFRPPEPSAPLMCPLHTGPPRQTEWITAPAPKLPPAAGVLLAPPHAVHMPPHARQPRQFQGSQPLQGPNITGTGAQKLHRNRSRAGRQPSGPSGSAVNVTHELSMRLAAEAPGQDHPAGSARRSAGCGRTGGRWRW